MKILIICNRFHCSRDIIEEDFGRSMQFARELSALGNEVHLFCADYKKFESFSRRIGNFKVISHPFSIMHSFGFICSLCQYIRKNRFDTIVATSVPLWGIIGYICSRVFKIPFVYDLPDNWDVLISDIPFGKLLKPFNSYVIKHADTVSCVSKTLKARTEMIRKDRKRRTIFLPNGVDLKLFKPMDRMYCRERLKLPGSIEIREIIAYTGSINNNRGISILINAFQILRREYPGSILLLCGKVGDNIDNIKIKEEGIIIKDLSQEDVVYAINAADVVVLPNPVNEFTRYCFPYKVLEYMACNAPVVATRVGDVKELLKNYDGCLCEPDNAVDMAEKIKGKLNKKNKNKAIVDYRKGIGRYSWKKIAMELNEEMKDIIKSSN